MFMLDASRQFMEIRHTAIAATKKSVEDIKRRQTVSAGNCDFFT